ncbi:Uncharacterised protein [Citrobacter koseri]|uniref:Uncharacterized protein n=1 Tax=Citrobacter koseri TaxID=545 RepID=A0A2X2VKD8_CITKO|nr:Uncharacterised protein [Citrobacter koseri]
MSLTITLTGTGGAQGVASIRLRLSRLPSGTLTGAVSPPAPCSGVVKFNDAGNAA